MAEIAEATTETTEPAVPTPADVAAQATTEVQPTAEPAEEHGAGSKEAVLADLAGERDRRQAAEAQISDLNTRIAEIKAEHRAEVTELSKTLAVYRNSDGANITALLDSKSFTDKLTNLQDFSDETVKALITEHVAANPAFAATPTKPAGVRDAAAGATPEHNQHPLQALADSIFNN